MKIGHVSKFDKVLLAFVLVVGACGSSGSTDDVSSESSDSSVKAAGETTLAEGGSGDTTAPSSSSGEMGIDDDNVLIGPSGFTIDLNDCPSGWSDTAGITDTEIRLGSSFPQSGSFAAFGNITTGQDAWYQYLNETEDGVDGKDLTLIVKDDAYEPARTFTNVQEMLQSENVFAFTSIGGTPHTFATYDTINEQCVPALFVPTGHPAWGDPNNHPWIIGSFLAYNTESRLWAQHLIGELEAGTFGDVEKVTVAALVMNNDFGLAYRDGFLAAIEDEPRIELVSAELHDPAAPNVSNEMTTLAGSNADVVIGMTTAVYCTQAFEAVAEANWDPKVKLFSNTCAGIESFFVPAGVAGAGWRHTSHTIDLADSVIQDDPLVQEYRKVLEDRDFDPKISQYGNGFMYAQFSVEALQKAAEMPGGITRTNAMIAARSLDFQNGMYIDGIRSLTDGVNDAYPTEAAVIKEYQLIDGQVAGTHAPIGEVIDVEGQSGLCHYVDGACLNE